VLSAPQTISVPEKPPLRSKTYPASTAKRSPTSSLPSAFQRKAIGRQDRKAWNLQFPERTRKGGLSRLATAQQGNGPCVKSTSQLPAEGLQARQPVRCSPAPASRPS